MLEKHDKSILVTQRKILSYLSQFFRRVKMKTYEIIKKSEE